MAVTRRAYIFGAVLSSILSVVFIIIALASDAWILSTARSEVQSADSQLNYGLFTGMFELNNLATPSFNDLYMTCVFEVGACAVSCKTTPEAREEEVRAMANRFRPSPTCAAVTSIDTSVQLEEATVISSSFYVALLVILFLHLVTAFVAGLLAVVNASMNPTEPIFGLPGCLWSNVVSSTIGFTALMMFGIYYASSQLKDHLAFSYIASGLFSASPGLGLSYWSLLISVLCSLTNVGLIELRRYLLERDPPPPTIKVENHSDGTVFLY